MYIGHFLLAVPIYILAFSDMWHLVWQFLLLETEVFVNDGGVVSLGPCDPGLILNVTWAIYGNTSVYCHNPASGRLIQGLCNGQTVCNFAEADSMFQEDPCPGVDKYIKVLYKCESHGDVMILGITGPLWGESTGDRWIPLTNGR